MITCKYFKERGKNSLSHADDVFRTSPKVPKGRLVSGHTKEFQTDPIGFLTRLSKEYGEVAKFRLGNTCNKTTIFRQIQGLQSFKTAYR